VFQCADKEKMSPGTPLSCSQVDMGRLYSLPTSTYRLPQGPAWVAGCSNCGAVKSLEWLRLVGDCAQVITSRHDGWGGYVRVGIGR
jgi:hypothetical protein